MKPFNLEEYLKNPARKIVTREGIKARVVCTDRKSESFPIIALVDSGNKAEKVYSFAKNGKFSDGGVHNLDLFFAPEKKEGWVNIFKCASNANRYVEYARIFQSKEDAEEAIEGDSDYITTLKIEWEE